MDVKYQIEELVMNMSFVDLDTDKTRKKIRDEILKITNQEEAHRIVSEIHNKQVADILFSKTIEEIHEEKRKLEKPRELTPKEREAFDKIVSTAKKNLENKINKKKITTEICVEEIEKIFGKGKWKRISKKGKEIIERVFENKENGNTVLVQATEYSIIDISSISQNSVDENETIYTLIKKEMNRNANSTEKYISLYYFIPRIIPDNQLPIIKTSEGKEELSFENFELKAINENTIVCWGGGDWQDPMTVSFSINKGKLIRDKKVKTIESDSTNVFDIIEKCYGTKTPKELQLCRVYDTKNMIMVNNEWVNE